MKHTILSLLTLLLFSCNEQSAQSHIAPKQKEYEKNDRVRSAYLDRDGNMWFGTNHEGVYRYDGERFERFSAGESCSDHVADITQDKSGKMWFATFDGLCSFDGKRFEHVDIPWDGNKDLWGPNLNALQVISIVCDSNGLIWFGAWGSGVHCFDPQHKDENGNYVFRSYLQEEGMRYGEGEGEHRNVIQSIVEAKDGRIWFTSMSHAGVFVYDGNEFRQFHLKDGLWDDMVFSAHEDASGNMWFGMLGNDEGGLAMFDGEKFTNYNEESGMLNNNVTSIFEDEKGKIWLGSHRDWLSIFDPENNTFTPFTDKSGKKYADTSFITEDAQGRVWFGGAYGGLYCYNNGKLVDHTQKKN